MSMYLETKQRESAGELRKAKDLWSVTHRGKTQPARQHLRMSLPEPFLTHPSSQSVTLQENKTQLT